MMILVVENEHYYFYNATCLIPASTHWKANFKGTRKVWTVRKNSYLYPGQLCFDELIANSYYWYKGGCSYF